MSIDTAVTATVHSHPTPGASARTPTPAVQRIRLATGVTLPYVEQGPANGTPVVMLHGVTDSWHSFEPVLPHLPPSLRVVVPTMRGHGDADRPDSGYRMRDFAADVAALMDALDVGPAALVGHSMGTTVALRFALNHPARARGLVLIGAPSTYRDNPAVVEFWQSAIVRLQDPVDRALALEFQQSTLARPIAPEQLDLFVRESLKVPARVWRAAFRGMMEDNFTAELARVAVPALCVWGEHDAFARRLDQDCIVGAIEGARLSVHRGAGHALHWEDPARFAAELVEFVERLS